MLEITRGQTQKLVVTSQLIETLNPVLSSGSLYIGFPILATADISISVDALLVTDHQGVVAFIFPDNLPESPSDHSSWQSLVDDQDQLFVAVENELRRHGSLRVGRRLAVEIHVVTIVPSGTQFPDGLGEGFVEIDALPALVSELPPLNQPYLKPLQAALQRVTTIKPLKRRSTVVSETSKGAVLRRIEREIANLDQWQKRAAIECPEGPQRIRGLAGSGKTIVLALKAAYLHAYNPDWIIGVTFFSRTLYQQFEDLIRRFSFAYSNDEPNWENLRVMHAWGGRYRSGVYSQIANHCGITPRDFVYARERFGQGREFEGVCSELWSAIGSSSVEPIYDVMLIDEAQDCSTDFFKLVHKVTRNPKRVVWAYDELQNLSENTVPSLVDQFGTDEHGVALVNLENSPNNPSEDVILPVCYRNTPWSLALAHGLGLGTAREQGLVQSFDDTSLWTQIGYRIVEGRFVAGESVVVERTPESYPEYFKDNISPDESVSSYVFQDVLAQAQWIADSVKRNLDVDELDPDDILIVLPSALSSRRQAQFILDALSERGINGHLVGVDTSQDEFFDHGSVAIAHIFRSKGNEAPVVYVANAQYCWDGPGLITRRNILFTAITRAKGWVRICGWGPGMLALQEEISEIKSNGFRLRFTVPTDDQLENMRRIHRDLTASERARINSANDGLRSFIEVLERGDMSMHDIPLELRAALQKYLARDIAHDAE